jgi:hypothetical protein
MNTRTVCATGQAADFLIGYERHLQQEGHGHLAQYVTLEIFDTVMIKLPEGRFFIKPVYKGIDLERPGWSLYTFDDGGFLSGEYTCNCSDTCIVRMEICFDRLAYAIEIAK